MILLKPRAYLADAFSAISKAHPKRVMNALVLRLTYHYSTLFNTYYHLGEPLALAVESYAGCGLRCPECPAGSANLGRSPGPMDADLFRKIIDETYPSSFYLAFHFLGEPFLNKDLLSMIHQANSRSLYTEVHTNGQNMAEVDLNLLLESGLNRLRFSVDGASQQSYETYRSGGELEKIITATREIRKRRSKTGRRKPFIIWQCILFRHNVDERAALKQLAKQCGADAVDFKTAWVSDPEKDNPLIPRSKKLNRYARKARRKSCWKPWHSAVVSREGKMLSCCYDKDLEVIGGDLSVQGLKQIWHSGTYNNLRQRAFRREFSFCKNCGTS